MKAPTPLEALLKERVALAVGPEMRAIEEAIARELASPVGLIHEMGEFIAGAGGKRLRPILLLMAARVAGYGGPRAVRMGCVVELLHTATLIHDDVVDQAPLRRGRPSANARWGDDASILVGDYLYSKSFALRAEHGDAAALETLPSPRAVADTLNALWPAPDQPAGRKSQLIHLITEAQAKLNSNQS